MPQTPLFPPGRPPHSARVGREAALPRASHLFRVLSSPRPKEKPAEAIAWPVWYLGFVFSHNRRFGSLYVFGPILSVLIPIYV